MELEVISKQPTGRTRSTPLLFIHGVFTCARIWEPFFLPFFADHGYPSYAVSLRGHGDSAGGGQLWMTRLRDYVRDVAQVTEQIGRSAVLVGTSMGGVLVQHYMRYNEIPAAILMASGPPHGMFPSVMRMLATNPLLVRDMTLMTAFGPSVATVETARRALFRRDTPAEYISRYLPYAQPESALAMSDLMAFDLPPSSPDSDIPVLVLGAERDAFVSSDAVRETARTFGVEAEIFPRMTHAMMLDEDWEMVATRILTWLDEVLPSNRASASGFSGLE